ncbi:MAG: tetratricopeptide repeat protein, partial [Cyanobacteria bacterium P01_H01_bin.105]
IDMTAADTASQQSWVVVLASHYLQWFDFDNAAQLYTQLVDRAEIQGNTLEHTQYLKDLIYSYQQAKAYGQALPAQSELLRLYRSTGQSDREPPLEIDMARNFRAIDVYPQALEYYNLAYVTAQSLQLYGHVSTVLKDLGDLYAEQGLTNEALTMYNLLVRAEQQAYNQHGILEAYDRLGKLYLRIDDRANALIAFRAGLAFSESLQYRQAYFRGEVARLSLDAPPEANTAVDDDAPLGDVLREELRDNPPFDVAPDDGVPVDVSPVEIEPVDPANDLPADNTPADNRSSEEEPVESSPEVEVISDEIQEIIPDVPVDANDPMPDR